MNIPRGSIVSLPNGYTVMPGTYPIVGIFGRMNAGKSTLATLIRDEWTRREVIRLMERGSENEPPFPQVKGFAYALKELVTDLFGIPADDLHTMKVLQATPVGWTMDMRKGLQSIGQFFREIQPDVWIRKCLSNAKKHPLIIDDGRYLNEFDSIKSVNGICIAVRRSTPTTGEMHKHISETQVDEILLNRTPDMWVNNDGTEVQLLNLVRTVIVPKILEHFTEDTNVRR